MILRGVQMNREASSKVFVMTNQQKGLVIAFIGAVLMSLDPIFIKTSGVAGIDAAFLFGLFASISMLSVLRVSQAKPVLHCIKDEGLAVWFSGVLMLLSASGFVVSLSFTSVANTFVIFCSSPIITALISRVYLKEALTWQTWFASGAVLAGVLIVVSGSLTSSNLFGDSLALLSVLFLSINQTYLRKHKNVSRVASTGVGALLLALALIWFVEPQHYHLSTWLTMGIMGLITAPMGRVFSQVATRYITATEVGMILTLEAVLAPYLAYLFLGEVPKLQSLAGGTLIFTAIVYFITFSNNQNQ